MSNRFSSGKLTLFSTFRVGAVFLGHCHPSGSRAGPLDLKLPTSGGSGGCRARRQSGFKPTAAGLARFPGLVSVSVSQCLPRAECGSPF